MIQLLQHRLHCWVDRRFNEQTVRSLSKTRSEAYRYTRCLVLGRWLLTALRSGSYFSFCVLMKRRVYKKKVHVCRSTIVGAFCVIRKNKYFSCLKNSDDAECRHRTTNPTDSTNKQTVHRPRDELKRNQS